MSHPKSWTKVSELPPIDLEIFKLRQLQCADPRTGRPHPRVVLDAPDWVNVIARTKSGEVVLIRQFRFGTWELTLEIPGGMVDPGEDVALAAARELEEETGYRPGRIRSLGYCHPNPAIQGNRLHTYLAEDCVQVHAGEPDEQEDISVELVPHAAIDELIRSGQITHSAVITAFCFEKLRGTP